jgi:MoxR-like ATPase
MDHHQATQVLTDVVRTVTGVIRGADDAIATVVATLAADGHVLLEDPPGAGKTTLVHALGRACGLEVARIQGTPDLLPGDITGHLLPDEHRQLVFHPGPVFAQLVLADELNRTPPRSQAALLEAMAEGTVTVDRTTHTLPTPHLVVATQNPTESAGTFPLPDSQLDRFTVRVSLGQPDQLGEMALVRANLTGHLLDGVEQVCDADQLVELQRLVRRVAVDEPVLGYATALTRATRDEPAVRQGASARATVHLVQLAQAFATLAGRTQVLAEDVKRAAVPVLPHRILMASGDAVALVERLLASLPVPR